MRWVWGNDLDITYYLYTMYCARFDVIVDDITKEHLEAKGLSLAYQHL